MSEYNILLFNHPVLRIALDSLTVKKHVWINIMSDFVVSQGALKPWFLLSAARQMCVAVGTLCHMVICLV